MTKTSITKVPDSLVDTEWLVQHINDPELRIIDCSMVMQTSDDGSYSFVSGKDLWEQGHIPGSIYVDVMQQLSDKTDVKKMMMPDIASFADTMSRLGIGDTTSVVLYDNSNHAWATRVWWMLRVSGFDNAAVLNGGWNKWTSENRPVSTEVVDYPETTFTPDPRPHLMASKQEVHAALDNADISIINALSPAVFNNEVQLFPRPGRIPGSCNVFCQGLIDPVDLTYLDLESLQEIFHPTGALQAGKVITYCGGGIAATSNALALVLLGVEEIAVYDGSMSEWTADPDMPMET